MDNNQGYLLSNICDSFNGYSVYPLFVEEKIIAMSFFNVSVLYLIGTLEY